MSYNFAVMFSGKIMGIVDGDKADIREIGIMMAGGDKSAL